MRNMNIFSDSNFSKDSKKVLNLISLPFGTSDFEEVRKNGLYYVDKTLLIKDLIRFSSKVTLFTRPRRFGKTLTMSMLQNFFDVQKDSKELFDGLKISKESEIYEKYRNQYPAIFVTLRSVEGMDFSFAFNNFKIAVQDMYKRHSILLNSSILDDDDKELFTSLIKAKASEFETTNALKTLINLLYKHYNKPVIVLIDEYDVPLAKSAGTDFYDRMLFNIRNFLSPLKDNNYLKFAVITGCLRISKESIFTGTNNFYVDSFVSSSFNEYFGFTNEEVQELLKAAGALARYSDVKDWYDGYNSNGIDLYCPWDVIHYVKDFLKGKKDIPKCYWINTSDMNVIHTFIERYGNKVKNDFEKLVTGEVIRKPIKENLTYDLLNSSEDNFWSILLMTGYLTSVEPDASEDYTFRDRLSLRIPNKEVLQIYKSTLKEFFDDSVEPFKTDLEAAVWMGDVEKFKEILDKILLTTISFYDYKEDFYHAFLLGIFLGFGYNVESNKEHGEGRTDIILENPYGDKVSIFELKHSNTRADLEKDCDKALKQIQEKKYAIDYEDDYDEVLCYGISFYRKRCLIKLFKLIDE